MFKFKQFTINQSRSAMKVCTDACLFGALIAIKNQKNILDIGTGTGVLSLMLAQKNPESNIIGIDIEPETCKDAEENFRNSKFNSQLKVINISIQEFAGNYNQKFNTVISNPPFYVNYLKSPNGLRNVALHAENLTYQEIVNAADRLLEPEGSLWILLPPFEMSNFEKIAMEKQYLVRRKIAILHDSTKKTIRHVVEFNKQAHVLITEEICIFEANLNTYTQPFKELLKDYYLNF